MSLGRHVPETVPQVHHGDPASYTFIYLFFFFPFLVSVVIEYKLAPLMQGKRGTDGVVVIRFEISMWYLFVLAPLCNT